MKRKEPGRRAVQQKFSTLTKKLDRSAFPLLNFFTFGDLSYLYPVHILMSFGLFFCWSWFGVPSSEHYFFLFLLISCQKTFTMCVMSSSAHVADAYSGRCNFWKDRCFKKKWWRGFLSLKGKIKCVPLGLITVFR